VPFHGIVEYLNNTTLIQAPSADSIDPTLLLRWHHCTQLQWGIPCLLLISNHLCFANNYQVTSQKGCGLEPLRLCHFVDKSIILTRSWRLHVSNK